jgi:CheY-like chemotaxis protein
VPATLVRSHQESGAFSVPRVSRSYRIDTRATAGVDGSMGGNIGPIIVLAKRRSSYGEIEQDNRVALGSRTPALRRDRQRCRLNSRRSLKLCTIALHGETDSRNWRRSIAPCHPDSADACSTANGHRSGSRWRCFANAPSTLVITDLMMPVMDGVELGNAIRSSEGARHPDRHDDVAADRRGSAEPLIAE